MDVEQCGLRLLSAAWDLGRLVIADAVRDGVTVSRSKLEGARVIAERVSEEVQLLVGIERNDWIDAGCDDLINMAGLLSDVEGYLEDGEPDRAMLLLKMYNRPGVPEWRVE